MSGTRERNRQRNALALFCLYACVSSLSNITAHPDAIK